MGISVDLARRYRIKSESYIDNTGNGSLHNHYEYYDRLVEIEPTEDDVISYQGKEVCKGCFLGHPNDDKSLYLVKSGDKVGLYEDETLLMDGENLFIYGDLCVQQSEGKYFIVDLKDNTEITSIEGTTFSGYDAEHKLFAFGDRVYSLSGDNTLTDYHGEAVLLKFDMPMYDITAQAHIKGGMVCQNNQYTSKIEHNYRVGTVSSDARLLLVSRTRDDDIKDKQDIIEIYFDKLAKYDGTQERKEEITTIQKAYAVLYDEDISVQKNRFGLTPFEKLCTYNFESNFFALRDFYLDDFKKETDTKLSICFTTDFFDDKLLAKGKLTDDDIKLMADFISRNPKVMSRISSASFLKFAQVSPEMVINWVKCSEGRINCLKELGLVRPLVNDILEQHGISFYNVEDFVLAPNKEFLESIKDKGFGEPQRALEKLCKALRYSDDKESFTYVTVKKLIAQLLKDNKSLVDEVIKKSKIDSRYVEILVKEGLVVDEQVVAKVNSEEKRTSSKVAALDAIIYGKRSVSLRCNLDEIADFSDFGYAAPLYHLSNESRTTFLNEMLIYGKGKEAAYALSHGASPFQKIEFFRGKKTGMPFTGLFLRAQKDNFAGVQSLMNEIARNLDAKQGQQIIVDIEKSLGQNLRSNPAVAEIMKNMRETFMHAKFEYEKKRKEELEQEQKHQKELEESRKFKIEHQTELDELDKAYRIANRKKIDEYETIFNGSTEFSFGRYSYKYLYTPENLDKVREKIVQINAHNQLVDRIKEQLVVKDENTDRSIKDRFSAFGYNLRLTEDGVVFQKGSDSYSRQNIPFAEDTISRLEDFVKQKEEKRRIEQEKEAEQKRLLEAQEKERQLKEQCKAMGLPSDIQIWHRVGAGTNCGEGWVIKPDGSFREPTGFDPKKYMSRDGYKTWEQILPGEVVLSWAKGNTAAEHEFEVLYMPKEGLTAAQKETILSIEEDIQETWKDKRGLSSGIPSPDVGMGWNICGRKQPLHSKECLVPVYTRAENEPQTEEKTVVDNTPDRPIEEDDLIRLLNAFGQSR